jgi:transposase
VTISEISTLDPREERGKEIALTRRLKRDSRGWLVPSQTRVQPTHYRVLPETEECTCPDYETRAVKCKHIWAVEYRERIEHDGDGGVTRTQVMRVTYRQEWAAYSAAQVEEKSRFMPLLAALCASVEQPEQSNGRPRLPLGDMTFAAVYKVFEGLSSRRFMSDLADAQAAGYIAATPHYNSVSRYLSDSALTPILQELIAVSALPLKGVETQFAVDSTGFSTCRFVRWYSKKYGRETDNREWIKLHLMCGTATKIVTSAEITGWTGADSPQFIPLVTATAKRMNMAEVSADKAYSSRANLAAVEALGAVPYVMFKANTVNPQAALWHDANSTWTRMYHLFAFRRDEFLSHYHRRSNVESVMSMIKRKFGDSVKSKSTIGQGNEALAKVLCHNLCVLIHCAHVLGIDPGAFEAELPVAPKVPEFLGF